ncbi:uncharacterized protein EDB93DRAFT_1099243 [Suillus bovinus]|uniref:uncharacterized protein n=1 Tax=Suillus bovinus TaxID=48563 RepID=UPI001B878AA0|nr:uncharacterized protein EDB93DRAFT_1099243 [Suillus bovinus]KAG2159782.1 hypothetical protein EDB93DRAFT_1099243 [Suillus bovinus]
MLSDADSETSIDSRSSGFNDGADTIILMNTESAGKDDHHSSVGELHSTKSQGLLPWSWSATWARWSGVFLWVLYIYSYPGQVTHRLAKTEHLAPQGNDPKDRWQAWFANFDSDSDSDIEILLEHPSLKRKRSQDNFSDGRDVTNGQKQTRKPILDELRKRFEKLAIKVVDYKKCGMNNVDDADELSIAPEEKRVKLDVNK